MAEPISIIVTIGNGLQHEHFPGNFHNTLIFTNIREKVSHTLGGLFPESSVNSFYWVILFIDNCNVHYIYISQGYLFLYKF